MSDRKTIFHIATLDELRLQIKDNYYLPVHFAEDGFIHCTGEKPTALLVLEDYYAGAAESNEIIVLELDVSKLESEVRFEAPAPVPGGGTSHLRDGRLFPHIYGKLNLDAVKGAGRAERINGKFIWPSAFSGLSHLI